MPLKNDEIAKRLDNFILKNFKNYKDFANTIMISTQSLTKYLRGEIRPGRKFISRCEVAGIDLSYVLGAENRGGQYAPYIVTVAEGPDSYVYNLRELLLEVKRIGNRIDSLELEFRKLTDSLNKFEKFRA